MSVVVEDQTIRLTLHHYQSVNENTPDDVKQTRGVIKDEDNNTVCSSYSFTPEYTLEEREKYLSQLTDLSTCAVFRSEEGTLLRLFFDDNRWTLSTHKRINAFESKWSSHKSFGDLFLEALMHYFEHDGKGKLQYEDETGLFDQFCNTLQREFNYTFLLRTNAYTKILCDPPSQPTVFFAGYFEKSGLWNDGNPTLLPTPERLTFASVEDLEAYVKEVNPFEHQGVIIMLPDRKTTIKIVSTLSMKYKQIRGSEPDVTMAYFRVRKSKEEAALFSRIFPLVNINKIEEGLFNIGRFVHRMYVRRYIKKQHTVIQPALFYLMKQSHNWHCLDRSKNIVTMEKMMDVMDEQPYMNLFRLYNEYATVVLLQ